MPTIVRVDGYRIMIYVDDHKPPHVHVWARGCEAVIYLNCPDGPPGLRDNDGFSDRELKRYSILSCAI